MPPPRLSSGDTTPVLCPLLTPGQAFKASPPPRPPLKPAPLAPSANKATGGYKLSSSSLLVKPLGAGLVGRALSSLSCKMKHHEFDPPRLRGFFFFSPGLTHVLIPLPSTVSGVSISRGLVCACKHSIVRTKKSYTPDLDGGECKQQKHTLPALTKAYFDFLYGWIREKK